MKRESDGDNPSHTKRPKGDTNEVEEDGPLLEFQKQAILLQMKEYKRKYSNAHEENLALKKELEETRIRLVIYEREKGGESGVVQDNPEIIHAKLETLQKAYLELENKLSDSEEYVDRCLKKINRLILQQQSSATPATSTTTPTATTTKPNTNENIDNSSLEIIEDQKSMLQSREKEIEHLVRKNQNLELELQQISIELRVLKSVNEKQKEIEMQLRNLLDEHPLRIDNEKLLQEVQHLRSSRREYENSIKEEEEKRRKVLEADLKKYTTEISRLRSSRDTLAKQNEILKSKTNVEEMNTLLALSDARKGKIEFLESEIQRLKLSTAGEIGELGLIKFFDESTENPYRVISSELEKYKGKVADLEKLLSASPPQVSLFYSAFTRTY
jgi:chromosome segregation ATPase